MAMKAQTYPSPPFSTRGLGPCELSCSYSTYYGHYHLWVFWSICGNDEVQCVKPHLVATANGALIKNKIVYFLRLLLDPLLPRFLVQFWGLVKIGNKMYLTTCDQPFALKYFGNLEVKQLCEYRKHCLDYLIPVDDDDEISVDQVQLGPPGRVFCSGLPEYTFDVRHYTRREYPQRDCAVDRVKGYWALPIYHPTQHLPSGVLEIVSTNEFCLRPNGIQAKLRV
ncbi:unnamed protein product [Coffea canephora]|uniref:Uncharacterized protein n=1 Tax=Coffea canephora TaxID=49390 RepID=A0A068V6W3_COFCA|nr:unnamed protein product [Coffea canephora]